MTAPTSPQWPGVHHDRVLKNSRTHPTGLGLDHTHTTESLSSKSHLVPIVVLSAAPAARTPRERLAAQVDQFLLNKRTSQDLFRENCQLLRQIKTEGVWNDGTDPSFDGWAWRVLKLKSALVSRMLGIAAGPIGGEGHAGRPKGAASRGRGREGQEGQVEEFPAAGNSSTSSPSPTAPVAASEVTATRAAAGRGALGWAARQLGHIERYGTARWRAGLTDAERTAAACEFARLSDLFASCARAVAGAAHAAASHAAEDERRA